MLIRFLAPIAGVGFDYNTGQEVDWDDADAARLIERGVAVPVRAPKTEKAVKSGGETA